VYQVETSADVAEFAGSPFEDPIEADLYLFAVGRGNLHVLGIGAVTNDWGIVGFADDAKLFEFG
jgi:hypothetical protein